MREGTGLSVLALKMVKEGYNRRQKEKKQDSPDGTHTVNITPVITERDLDQT